MVPILVFMLLYLWLVMRRVMGWPSGMAALVLVLFFISTVTLEEMVPEILWGGAMYLPTVAACLVLAMIPIPKEVRGPVLAAVAVFLLSLTFRTLDMPLCASVPIGTHFLWHILNAVVLYLLVHAAIMHDRPLVRSGVAGT